MPEVMQLDLFCGVEQGQNSTLAVDTVDEVDTLIEWNEPGNRYAGGRVRDRPPVAGPVLQPRPRLQGVEALLAIRDYGYDLMDPAFQARCEREGVLYVAGRPGGRFWEYMRNWSLDMAAWLEDEGVRFAQEWNGKRHRYSDEEMRSQWACVLIGRGKLEDCWRRWIGN